MSDFFNYGVLGLYAGGSSPLNAALENAELSNLDGVQSAAVALNYPRTDNAAWDGVGDQVMVERPTADLSLSYIFASGDNENRLGFFTTPSSLAPALLNANTERNFYVAYNEAGHDLIGDARRRSKVMALGNGVLTNYALNCSVGQPTLVNANIQGLNLLFQPSGSGQILPSVNKQDGSSPAGLYSLPVAEVGAQNYFTSRPSSVILTFGSGCAFGTLLSGQNSCPLQSFHFSVDLPRQPVKDLGWAYPNQRPVMWPVTINAQANGYLTNIQTAALNSSVCPDSGMDIQVHFKSSCSHLDHYSYHFKGAKLTSQNIGNSVGSLTQVSFNWSLKIFDLNRSYPQFYANLEGDIAYTSLILPQVEYTAGNAPLTFNFSTPNYFTVLSGPGVLTDNSLTFTTDVSDTVVVSAVPASGGSVELITINYTYIPPAAGMQTFGGNYLTTFSSETITFF